MERFIQYFIINQENVGDDLIEVFKQYGIDKTIYSNLKKYQEPEIAYGEKEIMEQFIQYFKIGQDDNPLNLVEALKKYGIEPIIYAFLSKERGITDISGREVYDNIFEVNSTRSRNSKNIKKKKVSPLETTNKIEFGIDEDKISVTKRQENIKQSSENIGILPLSSKNTKNLEIFTEMGKVPDSRKSPDLSKLTELDKFPDLSKFPDMSKFPEMINFSDTKKFVKDYPILVTGQQAPKDQLRIEEYHLRETLKREIAILTSNHNSLLSGNNNNISPPRGVLSQSISGFDESNLNLMKKFSLPHSPVLIGSISYNPKQAMSILGLKNKFEYMDMKSLEERMGASPERVIQDIDEEMIREMYRALERKVEINPSIKNLFKKYIARKHLEHSPERVQAMDNNTEFPIEYEDFSGYVKSFSKIHKKCGNNNCIHLKRFFEKIGFQQLNPYGNRLAINLPTTHIDKLPKIHKRNYSNYKI